MLQVITGINLPLCEMGSGHMRLAVGIPIACGKSTECIAKLRDS